jgi:hypothetical protein
LRRLGDEGQDGLDYLIDWVPDAAALLQWGGRAFVHPLDSGQLAAHLAAVASGGGWLGPIVGGASWSWACSAASGTRSSAIQESWSPL